MEPYTFLVTTPRPSFTSSPSSFTPLPPSFSRVFSPDRGLRGSGVTVNLWVVNERWLFSLMWCAGASSVTTNSCHLLKDVERPDWLMVSAAHARAPLVPFPVVSVAFKSHVFVCVPGAAHLPGDMDHSGRRVRPGDDRILPLPAVSGSHFSACCCCCCCINMLE